MFCMLCGIAWTQAEELLQPSVRDRRMQEIYTALRTHPEDLQQELESFFEMIREDYGYDAEYVKNLFVQTAMMMTCIAAEKNPSAQGMKDIDSILEEVRGINSQLSAIEGVTVDTLPAAAQEVADLMGTTTIANWISVGTFAGQYDSSFYQVLQDYAITDDMTVEQFCQNLDDEFAAASK